MDKTNAQILRMAVMWYGAGFLPKLRVLPIDDLEKVLKEAGDCSMRSPLHLMHKPEFSVPSWSEEKLTGGQVIALMVFGLFVRLGEREKLAGPLMNSWPEIRQALVLAPKGGGN